jgi:hypothetical protein
MAITRLRPDRFSVLLAIIAGSMVATASASACETGGKGGLDVACGRPGGDAGAPREGVPVVDRGEGAKPAQIIEHAAPHRYARIWLAGGYVQSRTMHLPKLSAGHATAKTPHADAATASRALSHAHVRVTRLRNGSILCCRELPPAHLVASPCGANDDTASGGDDSEDDDDSQDDQNGADDTDSPFAPCFYPTLPCTIAPEARVATSWIIPFFAPFLTLQRLLC